MTVIAWDGKTLAADKQSTAAGYAYAVTKIHRVPSGIVAFSGNSTHAAALLNWFKGDMDPKCYPTEATYDDGAGSVLVTNAGELFLYDSKIAFPEKIESKYFARGSGRDYALAALYLGKSAREAVQVACALDVYCGMGIDTLELDSDL